MFRHASSYTSTRGIEPATTDRIAAPPRYHSQPRDSPVTGSHHVRQFLRSKIHRATITRTDLHYEGSLTLDRDLMDAAAIADHEVIHVVNVNNGERFTTYAIEGARGSGVVGLNGAAARLGMPGDLVIIMTFRYADIPDGANAPTPIVIPVDGDNRAIAS